MIKVGENITEIPNLNLEKTKLDITEFIKQKVSEANTDGIVVGLSGGIDSTLSAYLACEALGKDKVFGIIMPSTTTPTDDKLHGIDIAQKLGIDYKEIAIDSILNEYLSMTQLEEDELSIGNLKARIRMSIIYYYANAKNYLVSGTGNKSEILIGYFTKYGDGACDIEPIGDLYKNDVYELAKFINVPQEIIEKPPRAGLWNNQTDEEEIGMSYDLIDQILYLYTEKDMKNSEIAEKLEISADDVDMIITKVIRSKHKSKVPESPQKTIL
nr:NAD+ synthase [uncultured Methanobrevibacter sp.]